MASSEEVPLRWQASKPTVRDRLSYLCCNEVLADVHFIVGRDDHKQRIPAHSFVLSAASAVFDAMLNGGLANNNSIEVPDVEPSAFLALLRFIYTDDVTVTEENVFDTLYAAHKYDVPALEQHCADFIEQSLCADNAFTTLSQARLFGQTELEQRCFEIIDRRTSNAFATQGFTEVDRTTLNEILSRETLRTKEVQLFEALCRWAEAECNRNGISAPTAEEKRAVMGDLIHLIRFPVMTPEDIASGPAKSGILSAEESRAFFIYFHSSPQPSIAPFNDSPRHGFELNVSRFTKTRRSGWANNGNPDKIMFTVDLPIFVTGFGLYGALDACEYKVNIKLENSAGVTLAAHDTSFICDRLASVFKVSFPNPVKLAAGVKYTASALLEGPMSSYGTGGRSRVAHSTGSPVFTFDNCLYANGTSTERGQIPEIYFCF